jgi:hypothetical protein
VGDEVKKRAKAKENTSTIGAMRICDVARELLISESMVRKLIDRGELRAGAIGKRKIVFREDLESYKANLRDIPLEEQERERERTVARFKEQLQMEQYSRNFIYFVQTGDGPIKIGITDDLQSRLTSLQTGSPYPLKLLTYISGGMAMEKKLHEMFRKSNIGGEWFSPSPMLLAYIEELKATKIDKSA